MDFVDPVLAKNRSNLSNYAVVSSFAFGTAGTFNVQARNPFGVPYTNNSNAPISVQFLPTGSWGWQTGSYAGPEGSYMRCSLIAADCPMPNTGVGSLLVRVGETFYNIGNNGQVEIPAHQTIYFMFNDAGTNFDKHFGEVQVNWFCLSGC